MVCMGPTLKVFKFGDIVATMWYRDELTPKKARRFIISCHGMPSHPYQHNPAKMESLLDEGFVMLFPNYIGTWASSGTMSWENCVKTVHRAIDFLKVKNGNDLYDNASVSWRVQDITLLGGSFGASVVLVAGAKSADIKNIIAVAGPTNWRDHSRIPEETEPIEELYDVVQNGWGHLWRIPSKEEWVRLVEGTADLNAVDYVDALKEKNILLIHGGDDTVVATKRSIELHESIKKGKGRHELLILEGEGHRGNDVVGRDDVLPKVLGFLSYYFNSSPKR